jgi:hypothetical protein
MEKLEVFNTVSISYHESQILVQLNCYKMYIVIAAINAVLTYVRIIAVVVPARLASKELFLATLI